mmetsp:Transcript_24296/g.55355  ORF Transcript_24296/g.55355 Transcript_24296/m.55355 type:complete len:211 (-) Transcript_24296:152-784(-)
MRLHGDTLGRKFLLSRDHLVNPIFSLGDVPRLEKRAEAHGASLGGPVDLVRLDEVVHRLGVSRSHGLADELRQPAVQRLLSSLEPGPRGTAGATLLTAHAESAGGSLTGGDAASFSFLAVTGSGGRLEVVQGEDEGLGVVDGGLVGLAALPIEHLHGGAGGGGDAMGDGGAVEGREGVDRDGDGGGQEDGGEFHDSGGLIRKGGRRWRVC